MIINGDPGRVTKTPALTETPAWFCRPAARQWRGPALEVAAAAFHAELPGYRPTELTELPALAGELGVGRVLVKDESTRMGLGAFKVQKYVECTPSYPLVLTNPTSGC